MGTRGVETEAGSTLYEFWDESVTDSLNQCVAKNGVKLVVNCSIGSTPITSRPPHPRASHTTQPRHAPPASPAGTAPAGSGSTAGGGVDVQPRIDLEQEAVEVHAPPVPDDPPRRGVEQVHQQ